MVKDLPIDGGYTTRRMKRRRGLPQSTGSLLTDPNSPPSVDLSCVGGEERKRRTVTPERVIRHLISSHLDK
jgi:hypothetical protein